MEGSRLVRLWAWYAGVQSQETVSELWGGSRRKGKGSLDVGDSYLPNPEGKSKTERDPLHGFGKEVRRSLTGQIPLILEDYILRKKEGEKHHEAIFWGGKGTGGKYL